MKHLKIIGLIIMIAAIMVPVSARAEGLGHARLSLMDGDVQIRSEDLSEWLPASVNMPLRDGDSIWVPEGARAEVQLADGTQVRLDEFSSLDLLNIRRDSSQFYLAEGSAYVNFMDGRSSELVQIDTPVSSVRAYDRAAFNVDVAGSGDTDVSVYKGMVYAESASGSTRVTAGNILEINDDYADLAPLGRADAWERWNRDRDRRFEERRYSSRYLPDELDIYANDFDDNGRWVSVLDYGYVWTPTLQVSIGWSPYRNGRWCWIGSDYVWVGYEPWGWAPYHYGRWAYAVSVGWFWVPPARGSVYWGPGYVGWVRTPTYVAWVPLAPRETYYGYGYYGPNSVNIINVNINTLVVKQTYKNVYVTNAVTVVHHDNFVKGTHVDFRVKDNPFLRERVNIGRPDIKPERESRMAVVRDIPRAKEPPKKIKEIRIREIKETRPMVRDRDKSVFSPDRPRKQMRVEAVEAPRERKRDRTEERPKDRDSRYKETEKQQQMKEQPGLNRREQAPVQQQQIQKKEEQQEKQQQKQIDRQEKQQMKEQPGLNRREQAPVQQQIQKKEEQQEKQQQKQIDRQEKQQMKEQPGLNRREQAPVQQQIQKKEERQQQKQIDRQEQQTKEQPGLNRKEQAPVQQQQIQKKEERQQQIQKKEEQQQKQQQKQIDRREKQQQKQEKNEKDKRELDEKDR